MITENKIRNFPSGIIEKLEIEKQVEIGSNIFATYTSHGKAIIQQQGTKGCTAATTAMLIMDLGIKPNIEALKTRTLADENQMIRDLEEVGLIALSKKCQDLSGLKNIIDKDGSCIVLVTGLEGHVVVVDEVSSNLSTVRLREPYHGWEITVSAEVFLNIWDVHANILQAKKLPLS